MTDSLDHYKYERSDWEGWELFFEGGRLTDKMFSPDGRFMIQRFRDGTVSVWWAAMGRYEASHMMRDWYYNCANFSQAEALIARLMRGHEAQAWRIAVRWDFPEKAEKAPVRELLEADD